MAISYEGIGQQCLTLLCEGSAPSGVPCTVRANDYVSVCTDEECFSGIISTRRGGYATVIVHGFVTLPYSGDAPELGFCPLVADGNGNVKVFDGPIVYQVFHIDPINKTVTFLL